jgi:hypothetical protein
MIFLVISIPMLIIICCICAACKQREHEDELYSNNTNKDGVNRQPAYIPDAAYTVADATIANMVEQVTTISRLVPDMTECGIFATDVVLVESSHPSVPSASDRSVVVVHAEIETVDSPPTMKYIEELEC